MKKLIIITSIAFFMVACGGGAGSDVKPTTDPYDTKATTESGNPSYDPKRGEGKFTKVEVGASLDAPMATNGEKVFGVKCSGCHKLSDEKLVGPGWKDVTKRHTAEWIMNFVTNTDEMLNKDPKAQAQLEICLVRMPNQNLSDDDARSLYEFMRKNDGIK
ncbi:c-type cytochrome [Ferruginibacter sp. SUN002]|uniref:c-type cytochrome n=1 Tax=Ferruginibacter sp. SUN002 TaxID=2937789 RepID=UPI003D35C7DD